MAKEIKNAIQRARLNCGLTQEALAERAGYSDDTIRAWESGARSCPVDALGILSEILEAPWLTGVYLRENYRGGLDAILPDIRIGRPLPEAAADYMACVLEMVDGKFDRKLLRIIADGKITDEEHPVFEEIMAAAEATVRAYYEMRFARHGGDEG